MLNSSLDISCLCGKASQKVAVLGGLDQQQLRTSWEASRRLCHCDACRRATGLLCTSFLPVSRPPQSSLDELAAYPFLSHSTNYFCPTCGCHVFRCRNEEGQWAVATGTIVGSPDVGRNGWEWDWDHEHVSDTRDGGLSVWIGSSASASAPASSGSTDKERTGEGDNGTALPAACYCGNVLFHITRPDNSSRLPQSPFPDLMLPYCRSDASVVQNLSDVKWWLRGQENPRYFAGCCACRSCRLASGFDIQTWAFIPRSNIFISDKHSSSQGVQEARQLDFDLISPGTLKSFESSPGVTREFCPRCGATVFWHNKERPDLIDVSVGLLDAPDGARAQCWLDWWTGRVSFAEEVGAQMQRQQIASVRAGSLIANLEHGLGQSSRA